ncbi:MAG: hypothetical protein K6E29_00810 [Cyanobacteria bacterium RUI128]|nr:hypothetical protein [Cyanobacteria bacterium RUI128]
MKKITTLLLLLIFTLSIVSSAELKVTPPQWDDILPQEAKYSYKEPIKRPKWAYPAAWVACIGTCGLAQIPYIMRNKDKAIASNNSKFRKYEKIRQQFDTDIKNCEVVHKNTKDLAGCYMNVKQHYQLLLNTTRTQELEEYKIDLLEEQNYLIRIQNSRINSQPYKTKQIDD